jgi:uncharacterized protein (UPF0548 family)
MIRVSQMFFLRRPTEARIRWVLESKARFSYREVGGTATLAPSDTSPIANPCALGRGAEAFSLRQKPPPELEDVLQRRTHLCRPGTSVAPDLTVVAVRVRTPGIHSVHVCRIVYVFDEPRRFGFAHGALTAHAEAGEERFPGRVVGLRLGVVRLAGLFPPAYPSARYLQFRFRRDWCAAMKAAISRRRSNSPRHDSGSMG